MPDLPIRMHKDLVIAVLQGATPEEASMFVPGYADADSAIAALEAHPGEWIVGGELLPPDDPRLAQYGKGSTDG